MLYAVIGDIHANLPALQAVLRFLRRKPIRCWLVLGDIVGYGAHPNEVTRIVMRLRRRWVVRGNHDRVAAGLDTWDSFNEVAAEAIRWTIQRLQPTVRGYLRHLPRGPLPINEQMVVSHGCPLDEDFYILSPYEAHMNFEAVSAPIIWFGHTHLPVIYRYDERKRTVTVLQIPLARRVRIRLQLNSRYMINPGSVGQPRDRFPWLSFCTFDDQTWTVTFYRLAYDVPRAQRQILRAGLPPLLAHRLALGV